MNSRAVTDAVLADYRTAPIDEKLRAMLGFISKLNADPASIGPSDAEAVLKAGVTEQAFRDALYVVAMFELINRLADAFGFAVPEVSTFEETAGKIVRFGYRL